MAALDQLTAPAQTDEELTEGQTPLSMMGDGGDSSPGGALGALSKKFISQAGTMMPTRDDVLEKRQVLDEALKRLAAEQAYRAPGFDPDLAGFAQGIAGAKTGGGTPGDQAIAAMHAAHMAELMRQQNADITSAGTLTKAAEQGTNFSQQDISNAESQEKLAEQAAGTAATAGFKAIQAVHLPNGQTIFVNKITGQQINGGTEGSGTGTGAIPPKVASILKEGNLDPSILSQPLDKDEIKTNGDEYKNAVDANASAREAAASAAKIMPALDNYRAGTGGTTLAGLDAILPEDLQSESLQNTQKVNKMSAQIATQLAAGMKGARIGIGMDKFLKSSTIDPTNAPEVNKWIAQNIIDTPGVTKNAQDLQAYAKSLKPQASSLLVNKFYEDNPVTIDDKNAPEGQSKINPAYKDPQLFRKWLFSTEQGGGAPAVQPNGQAAAPAAQPSGLPAGAKQAPDGQYYVPDPNRPGKYLRVKMGQ